jgi:S-adenosylmethionine synthetase
MSYQFTSESVSEGHPDKISDLISDTIANAIINGNINHRAAVETLVTTNSVVVAGEYKRDIPIDDDTIDAIVRQVVKNIGYEQDGFHWANLTVVNKLHGQSADIALGTDEFGAGDQGLMFGYACDETPELMPSAIYYSHKILKRLAAERRAPDGEWIGPDSKSQVKMQYDSIGKPVGIKTIVCSTQHSDDVSTQMVRDRVEQIITDELSDQNLIDTEFLINPTGRFVIGGPDGDTGLTGRKIIVDTYGGYAPHGGGAFSGKDCTKVDRSAAYMARYLAKNIVGSGKASNCTVQLSYAIGVVEPTSVYVYADGKVREDLVAEIISLVDLTPKGIIDKFGLFNMDLTKTTNYGHFGKPDLPWEQLDLYGLK